MENGGMGSRGGRKLKFSKMSGSIFPALGDQEYVFLAYSRTSGKIKKWGVGGMSEALKSAAPRRGAGRAQDLQHNMNF